MPERLSANGHLARCYPDFNAAFFETGDIAADDDRIIGTGQAEAELAPHISFGLPPIFEFVPARTASAFEDFLSAAGDGLVDSAGLLRRVHRSDSDCVRIHEELLIVARVVPARQDFLGGPDQRLQMHGTNQRTRDQAPLVRFCEKTICKFAVAVLSNVELRFEYDFGEAQLAFRFSQRSLHGEFKSEEFQLRHLRERVESGDLTTRDGSHEKVLGGPIAGITLEFGWSRELNGGSDSFGRDFASSPAFPSRRETVCMRIVHIADSF